MVSTSEMCSKTFRLFMEQQANATVFQTYSDSPRPQNDIVSGNRQNHLGQWRYGVDPCPRLTLVLQLNPGSNRPPDGRQLSQSCHGGVPMAAISWALCKYGVRGGVHTRARPARTRPSTSIQRVPVNGACCTRPLDALFALQNPTTEAGERSFVDESLTASITTE